MTKRSALAALVAMIAAIALVPTAQAGSTRVPRHVSKRTVSSDYNFVASSSEEPIQYNVMEPLEVDVREKERWADIEVEDMSSQEVGALVTQDVDGDGAADEEWEVCGATPAPIQIAASAPLTVAPAACAGGSPATSGTVHVTLLSPSRPPTGPKVERTVPFTYVGWVYPAANGVGAGGGSYGIPTYSIEIYVEVQATDASGLPVHVVVDAETGRDHSVCSSTDDPLEIEPGSEILVRVSPEPCPDGTPVAMTTGQVEITLSNRP